LVPGGCGKKADESKPLSEVKAEAGSMSVEKLRSMAITYKDAITAKKGEIEKVVDNTTHISFFRDNFRGYPGSGTGNNLCPFYSC